jgi:DNA-binding transcriptional regulator YhcF (GntR family)
VSTVRIETLDRTSGGSTSEQVYLALREAIVSAELEPGLKLSENELAGELGVSRTPVREAVARLRDERLVAIVPQLGTFVTLISPGAVADAEFVREALECAAITRTATSPPRSSPRPVATSAPSTVSTKSCTTACATTAATPSPGFSAAAPTGTSTASAASACPTPST